MNITKVIERNIYSGFLLVWNEQPLYLKVTAVALPVLFLLGGAAFLNRFRNIPKVPNIVELDVENTPHPTCVESLKKKFTNESWFQIMNPLLDETRALPMDPDSGKIYKFLRRTAYPKLIDVGLWTDEANIDLVDLCIAMLFVCAHDALNEIEKASRPRKAYLNSQTHYTGIFLFDFFDFYYRARSGYKTITTPEGNEALLREKDFEPINFTTPGTKEYQWSCWRSEILSRLRACFSEKELHGSALKKLIG